MAQKFEFLQNSSMGKWFHETELRGPYLYYKSLVVFHNFSFFWNYKSDEAQNCVLSIALIKMVHRRTYMQWLCVHGYHLMHYKKCPPIIISASTLHWRHMSNNSYHYVWPIFDIFLSYWLTSKMPEILTHTNLSHFVMQDHNENLNKIEVIIVFFI